MLNFEIISITGVIKQGQAHQIVVPTTLGDIGFMQDHESTIANIREGKILILDEKGQEQEKIEIKSGTVEMASEEKLTILLDS